MGIKVTKFGGSSLADANQIRKVQNILASDPTRRYMVPSAPGKRFKDDDKITDLLYKCHDIATTGKKIDSVFEQIRTRYLQIAEQLGVTLDVSAELDTIYERISAGEKKDYAASRGEYLNGKIIASALGWDFVDAAEVIRFNQKGIFDAELTNQLMADELAKHEYAIIPGFYGSRPDGTIKTFSRGGSDITGSIVARAVGAELYENWTDVSGFMVVDPRIVENPKTIHTITYRELRELSYMGATVLHEDAIFPVSSCGIPINIRNTNIPEAEGTMIVSKVKESKNLSNVTGIAGKKNFTVIHLEKDMMNVERGFGRKVLTVLEDNNISFEHLPTGIDNMSLVVSDKELDGKADKVIADIKARVTPDIVELQTGMALIAVVGRAMVHSFGTAGKVFGALGDAGINVRMIDQGSSELNIIVGVDNDCFEKAINVIYNAFFN